MVSLHGLIALKIYTNHPLMPDENISEDEASKSEGQGAVGGQRSKNAATLKICRLEGALPNQTRLENMTLSALGNSGV